MSNIDSKRRKFVSKKKVIGCVAAGAIVATAVTAKLMRNKAQKSTYKAVSLIRLPRAKWDFMKNM